MALELDKLIFSVSTEALDDAISKIEKLGTAVSELNKPLGNLEKETKKVTKAQADQNKVQEESNQATKVSTTVLERQQKILEFMTQGFSKGQSSVLAYATAAGAATSEIKELGSVLQTQRKLIGGDPFDKSTSGLIALTTKLGEAKEANRLYTAGLDLTKAQTRELARDKERLIEKMKVEGASLTDIKNKLREHNAEYIAIANAINRLDQAEEKKIQTERTATKATDFLTREMQRAENALAGLNEGMNISSSNRLLRFKEGLVAAGVASDEAARRYEAYARVIAQSDSSNKARQKNTREEELKYLARATSVQMGDIGVSLAGGQNPLTVFIQQGDQLRAVLNQVGGDAKEMEKAMSQAFQQIVVGFVDVAKAMGTFVVGAFKSAGASIVDFAMNVTGMNAVMEYSKRLIASQGEEYFKYINILNKTGAAFAGVIATGLAASIAAFIALGIALKEVIQEESALTKSLVTTGASLGLSKDAAVAYAESLNSMGVSTTKGIAVITEMAKQGGFTKDAIVDITKAAIDLEKYAGVSIEKTVDSFAKFQDKPTEALSKVAIQTGLVSEKSLELVRSLEEQGKKAEATAEAVRLYGQVVQAQADLAKMSLAPIETLWLDIKSAISGAFEALKNVARSEGMVTAFRTAFEAVAVTVSEVWFTLKSVGREIGGIGAQLAAVIRGDFDAVSAIRAEMISDGQKARQEQEAYVKALLNGGQAAKSNAEGLKLTAQQMEKNIIQAKASAEWEKVAGDLLDKKTKREEGALKIRNAGIAAGKSELEIQKAIAVWNDKNKDPKGKQPKVDKSEAKAIETLWESITDSVNKANIAYDEVVNGADKYSASQKKMMDIVNNKAFLAMPEELQKEALARLAAAHATEVQTEAVKKQREEVRKAWEASVKAQGDIDKANFDLLQVLDDKNQLLDEEIYSLMAQKAIYGDLTSDQKKMIEYKKIELAYAKELQKIDNSKADSATKDEARALAEANKLKAKRQVDLADELENFKYWSQSLSDIISTSLFEGGKAGSKKLRDLIVNELKKPITMVINATVSGFLNNIGIGGGAGAGAGGNAFSQMGTGNYLPVYNQIATSSVGQSLGLSTPGTIDVMGDGVYGSSATVTGFGKSVGQFAQAAGEFLGYANALNTAFSRNAQGGKDYGKAMGQAVGFYFGGPIGSMVLGEIGSALGLVDYGGTYHTGGIGSYSKAGGTKTGAAALAGGMSFGLEAKDYNANGEKAAAGFAKGIVSVLDSTATTFGKKAGYAVSTAFADDISPDGSWGALFIKLGESTLVDWKDGQDKWPGREFADGDEGLKEYQAAVAKDVRDYLITQTPDWADAALNALGDAPTLEQLAGTVSEINAAATAFDTFGMVAKNFASISEEAMTALVKAMGGAKEAAAGLGSYYSLYYTEDERKDITRQQTTAKISALGVKDVPTTRAEYRNFIDNIDLTTDSGRQLYASMISLAPAFASYTDEVMSASDMYKAAMEGIKKAKEEAEKQQNDALKNLEGVIAREKQLYQAQLDAASKSASAMQSLFDLLSNNINELRGNVESSATMSAKAANAFIDKAVSDYIATGILPDSTKLSDAIDASRSNIDSGNYSTSLEYERAQLILANKLDVLAIGAEDQMTVAQRTLEAAKYQIEQLDATLEYWKQQVSLAQGGIDATMTVTDAVNALTALFDKSKNPTSGKTTGGGAGGVGFTTGAGGIPANAKPFSKEDVYASIIAELNTKGVYAANWHWVNGIGGGMAGYDRITDPGLIAQYDAIRDYGQQLYEGAGGGELGAWAVYNAAVMNGVSSDQVATSFGMTPEQLGGYLDMYGIPSFDVGTNRIPRDMLAMVHKDEAIVPAAYNPALAGNQDNVQLRAENAALRSTMEITNRLLERVAKSSEKTERAMTNVTEGGTGMVLSTPVLAL